MKVRLKSYSELKKIAKNAGYHPSVLTKKGLKCNNYDSRISLPFKKWVNIIKTFEEDKIVVIKYRNKELEFYEYELIFEKDEHEKKFNKKLDNLLK